MASDVVVVENFYNEPDRVRDYALKSRYANIELTDYPGFASELTVSNDALKSRFEDILEAPIIVDAARFTWGGFRFITEDTGQRAIIHADAATDWAAMVYLTPGAPLDRGTGFFRHKASGLTGPPKERDARALGFADSSEFDDKVIQPDKADWSKWDLIRSVEPVFNRLVLFRGGSLYHAPLGGCGNDGAGARLAHMFFFNTVEKRPDRLNSNGIKRLNSRPISLLDAACARVGLKSEAKTRFARVRPGELAKLGAEAVARAAVIDNALATTAAELAEMATDVNTLLIVTLSSDGELTQWQTLDGWSLLNEVGAGLDLRGANLSGARLAGADLSGCDLTGADLSRADLTKADLSKAKLLGADLSGATLMSATLANADLTEADLSRVDLRHGDLRGTNCARAAFRGADLWNTYTWDSTFDDAFTEGVDLSRGDDLKGAVKRAHL